jgi:hypothetical protein
MRTLFGSVIGNCVSSSRKIPLSSCKYARDTNTVDSVGEWSTREEKKEKKNELEDKVVSRNYGEKETVIHR